MAMAHHSTAMDAARRFTGTAFHAWKDEPAMSERRRTALLLAAVAVVYALNVAPTMATLWGDDNAMYVALSLALGHVRGYRELYVPGAPHCAYYPPGYPALLAPIWWFGPLGATGVTAGRALSALCMLGAVYLWHRILRRHLSPGLALLATLTLAVFPPVLDMAQDLMSDAPFTLLLALSLVLTQELVDTGSRRTAVLTGLLLGTLPLVRDAGLPLVAGVWAMVALRRRSCLPSLLLGQIPTGLLWLASQRHGSSALAHLAAVPSPVLAGPLLVNDVLPDLVWPWRFHGPALASLACPSAPPPVLEPWPLVGVLVLLVAVAGWVPLARRGQGVAWVPLVYLATVVSFHWPPLRFMVPLLPVVGLCLLMGSRRCAPWICALSLMGSLAVDAGRIHDGWIHGHRGGPSAEATWQAFDQGCRWLALNTPPDGVVATPYRATTWLLTGRVTVEQNDISGHAAWVLNAPKYNQATGESISPQAIDEYRRQHPGALQETWASPGRQVVVYRNTQYKLQDGPTSQ
ncbi:MAG TPA: glycosyltransferase family 39 protein [Candidatus Xenobia bacterium]|jgi:hypothetical protein